MSRLSLLPHELERIIWSKIYNGILKELLNEFRKAICVEFQRDLQGATHNKPIGRMINRLKKHFDGFTMGNHLSNEGEAFLDMLIYEHMGVSLMNWWSVHLQELSKIHNQRIQERRRVR